MASVGVELQCGHTPPAGCSPPLALPLLRATPCSGVAAVLDAAPAAAVPASARPAPAGTDA